MPEEETFVYSGWTATVTEIVAAWLAEVGAVSKGEQLVNCPKCSGSGTEAVQVQEVITDPETGKRISRTATVYRDCKGCDGMGVIPGGPPQ